MSERCVRCRYCLGTEKTGALACSKAQQAVLHISGHVVTGVVDDLEGAVPVRLFVFGKVSLGIDLDFLYRSEPPCTVGWPCDGLD